MAPTTWRGVTSALLLVALCAQKASASCDAQCMARGSSYEKCVRDCEQMAVAVAAANGGVPSGPPPPCFGDLVSCGLTGNIPSSSEDAEAISKQISGCMFLQVATNQLSSGCAAEVDKVGKDKIIECVGMATNLCGSPSEQEMKKVKEAVASNSKTADSLPDSAMCMAQELPTIASMDVQCAELVEKFIRITAFAKAAAANAAQNKKEGHRAGDHGGSGDDGEGGKAELTDAEEVAVGVFGGLAFAALAGGLCAMLGLVKGCQWATQKYKYGTLSQQEDVNDMEMTGGGGGRFRSDDDEDEGAVFGDEFGDEFDQEDI